VNASIRRQRGATLVVALILLVVITLLAVSALGTTTMQLKVVGNMQARNEALAAAQQAIEAAISSLRFVADPHNALPDPCGEANTLCTDLDGDGTPEYVTRLDPAPTCVYVKAVKESELNLSSAEDLSCAAARARRPAGQGVWRDESLCADTVWDITADSRATYSRTRVTVTQGIAVRIRAADAAALCGSEGFGESAGAADEGARGAGGARGEPRTIVQRRRRVYWYTHFDQ
jgi:Tfp pilus assembly protein PilX